MKKQIVTEEIFRKHYSGYLSYIPFSDLPLNILPTDFINIEKEEEEYRSDGGNDAYTVLTVLRKREQTDEEFEKSKKFWEEKKEQSKKQRYKDYLKLKKEFEDKEPIKIPQVPPEEREKTN